MNTAVVTIELPIGIYTKLQALSTDKQKDPVEIISNLVTQAIAKQANSIEDDPIFELIGAYSSELPLIDDIPVSEDPDLYVIAEKMGDSVTEMHAWELAPKRYIQSKDGKAIRLSVHQGNS